MEKIIINGGDCQYLSELREFANGLPMGVVNKGNPDVGGTYLAANCDSNYIIIAPYKPLVQSIAADKNNKYNVFMCYGGVSKSDFKRYLAENTTYKVAVTWDSFYKIVDCIDDFKGWKVVIDEYHDVLDAMDYREEAINSLLGLIQKFEHYTFMSATPIADCFEISLLKNLPHYIVKWNRYSKINPIRLKTTSVSKSLVKLINIFLNEGFELPNEEGTPTAVESLFIFCNSVTLIEQVCRTLDLPQDLVKISCANVNRNRLLLNDYDIEDVTAPNKRINFFTKVGFQGCNLFSNNGLVIVVSDGGKAQTAVDISSTMVQIAGRLRENKEYHNIFRQFLVHLYSTNNNIPTAEEFEAMMQEKADNAKTLISGASKLNEEEREAFLQRLNLTAEVVSIKDGTLVYNELKEQSFRFKQSLKEQYRNGYNIRAAYNQTEKFTCTNQQHFEAFEVKVKAATTISYEQLLKDYLETRESSYELEYPEFIEIVDYLTEKEMNSLRWNKDKMLKAVQDKRNLNNIFRSIYKEGLFISNTDLKKLFAQKFKEQGISLSPKASIIEDCVLYDVTATVTKVNGKTTRGYKMGKSNIIFNNPFITYKCLKSA